MTDLTTLINGATSDPHVRRDLQRLAYNASSPTSGLLTPDIMASARRYGHAAELSAALQRIEERVGNEGNFGLQRQVDMVQQEYDRGVGKHARGFRSGDRDGFQDYDRNPGLASAQRTAEHQPANKWNASQASAEIQRRQNDAIRNGDWSTSTRIDRLQKLYERDEGIAGTWLSRDTDAQLPIHHYGADQRQWIASAIALSFMMRAAER